MIHLFIDTNRYLLLYGFSEKDLEEIKKLSKLIKEKKITLWLLEQVINEFLRNRHKIPLQKCESIRKLISDFKIPKLPEIPEFEKEIKEIEENFKIIKKTNDDINSKVENVIKLIKSKIKEESFLADKIIEELFSIGNVLKYDEQIIDKAKTRFDLGIPPGKEGSYGDAVIWETLLKEFPEKEELHFVGFDNDFRSNIDDNEFSPFLLKEWKDKKKSNIIPYKHLGEFTKSKKIIEEEERVDKKYLITTTALNEAMKEITKSTYAWREIFESLNAYRNAISNAVSMVNIPTDIVRQQAELARQYSEAMNMTLKNIKMPYSIFAEAVKSLEPFRESIAKDAIKEAREETGNQQKKEEKKDNEKDK